MSKFFEVLSIVFLSGTFLLAMIDNPVFGFMAKHPWLQYPYGICFIASFVSYLSTLSTPPWQKK